MGNSAKIQISQYFFSKFTWIGFKLFGDTHNAVSLVITKRGFTGIIDQGLAAGKSGYLADAASNYLFNVMLQVHLGINMAAPRVFPGLKKGPFYTNAD